MSCMVTSFGNSGGGGVGALLGSKKVKALVVRGTGAVKVARPTEVRLLSNYMIKELVGGNNNHPVPTYPQSWASTPPPAPTAGQARRTSTGKRPPAAPSPRASSRSADQRGRHALQQGRVRLWRDFDQVYSQGGRLFLLSGALLHRV